MQSEALAYAYRVWRREWRGKGKEYVCPSVGTVLGTDQHRTEAHLFGKLMTVGQSHHAQSLITMCAVKKIFFLAAALRFSNSSVPSLRTLQ
jgi:hypothetical protein